MAGDRRLSRPDASVPDWEVPDTSYRPIPIVWFTGALIVQMIALTAIAVLFASVSGWLMVALGSVASGAIFTWTWDRGMKSANRTWKGATALMIIAQLLFFCIIASSRI